MSFARCGALLVLLIGASSMAPPSRAQDTALAIDGRQSSVQILVHMRVRAGGEGLLNKVSGELRGSPAKGWKVVVRIDGRSLHFAAGRWMDRITRSDSFLAVERYPGMRFESAHFSDGLLHAGGELQGELTLRGLSRPVSLRLLSSSCARPGRDCDIQVRGTISRRDFGMNSYRALVLDGVDLHLRVRLVRGASP